MSSKKEWFVSLKNLQPSELEYYLEEQASKGMILKKIGEMGLFYYEFEEGEATKTKYVVDKSGLPKEVYIKSLTDNGWELMGTNGPFYIWRQDYTEKRPKDFTDMLIRAKTCKIMAIVCLVITILLCILTIGYGNLIYQTHAYISKLRLASYVIGAIIQIPFILFFARAFLKFRDVR